MLLDFQSFSIWYWNFIYCKQLCTNYMRWNQKNDIGKWIFRIFVCLLNDKFADYSFSNQINFRINYLVLKVWVKISWDILHHLHIYKLVWFSLHLALRDDSFSSNNELTVFGGLFYICDAFCICNIITSSYSRLTSLVMKNEMTSKGEEKAWENHHQRNLTRHIRTFQRKTEARLTIN